MFPRLINLPKAHSFFLFGPRGTGKTTLLRDRLSSKAYTFDLLDYDLEQRLLERPGEFAGILAALPETAPWIIIDEVQKLPWLLDEVHRHIEKNPNRHFALTGSSARKLKRGRANLLAGRAFALALGPLTTMELEHSFDLDKALAFGTLPKT
ncbi:MAG: AAA family ATPase, partial [Elusimicrobia bacterium]|nr:AAA family ATPase [Elusimicrobiota bacterium]